jgi:hypothetical protein
MQNRPGYGFCGGCVGVEEMTVSLVDQLRRRYCDAHYRVTTRGHVGVIELAYNSHSSNPIHNF